MKYNMVTPKKKTSKPINFLLILIYHLIYLLVNKFINLSLYTNKTMLNNKELINIVISIDKINNKIPIQYICSANIALE